MCEGASERGHGWKGWRDLPQSPPMTPRGAWIDLSHPLTADAPRVPTFPRPHFELMRSMPADPLNVTRMDMVIHIGTHIDSPWHFFLDAPALDDIPLDRLCGHGIVWPVDLDGANLVEPRHLAGLETRLRPGSIVVLDTGWHAFAGTPAYTDEHCALSLETADWLVEHRVKMIALDLPTPDQPVNKRPEGFDYPIRRRLLSHGVLIAEHVTNLHGLRDKDVEIVCAALNIAGCDGAPARMIAREVAFADERP